MNRLLVGVHLGLVTLFISLDAHVLDVHLPSAEEQRMLDRAREQRENDRAKDRIEDDNLDRADKALDYGRLMDKQVLG